MFQQGDEGQSFDFIPIPKNAIKVQSRFKYFVLSFLMGYYVLRIASEPYTNALGQAKTRKIWWLTK